MALVTASVSPGRPDAIEVNPQMGLLAVAHCPAPGPDGPAACRLALTALRTHLARNDDVLARFRRHPSPDLRQRILRILEEGYHRAAQELFALARRRDGIEVTLDVALLLQHEAFVAHLGAGRVYLVRRGLVHQLTVDPLSDPPFATDRQPDALASDASPALALGPQPRVEVEALCIELVPEDRFVVVGPPLIGAVPEPILHDRFTASALDALPQALQDDAGGAALAAAAQLGSGAPFDPHSAVARLALLAPMPLFAHCTEAELRTVAQATRPRRFPTGSVIFEQGDPGHALYLLIAGHVEIRAGERRFATLGPGSNFGEMALLDEPARSATAIAASDTELLLIGRDAFFAMMQDNPLLAVKILWSLALGLSSKLRRTSAQLAQPDGD